MKLSGKRPDQARRVDQYHHRGAENNKGSQAHWGLCGISANWRGPKNAHPGKSGHLEFAKPHYATSNAVAEDWYDPVVPVRFCRADLVSVVDLPPASERERILKIVLARTRVIPIAPIPWPLGLRESLPGIS